MNRIQQYENTFIGLESNDDIPTGLGVEQWKTYINNSIYVRQA